MNTELTFKQKEIIEDIVSQFVLINNSVSNTSFSVLDGNKLNKEANRIKPSKEELLIHERSMNKVRNELFGELNKKLNDDFKNFNLPFTSKILDFNFGDTLNPKIIINSIKIECNKKFDYNFLNLQIKNKYNNTEFGIKTY